MKTFIKILTTVTFTLFMLGCGTASAQYYRPHARARVVIRAEFGRPLLAIRAVIPAYPRVVVVNPGHEMVYFRMTMESIAGGPIPAILTINILSLTDIGITDITGVRIIMMKDIRNTKSTREMIMKTMYIDRIANT